MNGFAVNLSPPINAPEVQSNEAREAARQINLRQISKGLRELSISLVFTAIALFFVLLWLLFQLPYEFIFAIFWIENGFRIVTNILELKAQQTSAERAYCILLVVESISMAAFKVMVILHLKNLMFTLPYTTLPLFIHAIVRLVYYMCASLRSDCGTLQDFVIVLTRSFFASQLLLIFLQVGKYIAWDWEEVFWLFWVWFSMAVGVAFGLILMLFTKIVANFIGHQNGPDIRGLIHILSLLGNVIISTSLITTRLLNALKEGRDTKQEAIFPYVAGGSFALLWMTFVLTWKKREELTLFSVSYTHLTLPTIYSV
eukprot:TRINITY_DN6104_c0_g2_i2.p1 TRINITY_DN6104_c0_g2~~TRINITY_DN6104_c0_g2_i2.p1  ORF type:complete len:314 (-),score=15.75 TRINITY_DN6104_c0_g2_i2:36-977(-)